MKYGQHPLIFSNSMLFFLCLGIIAADYLSLPLLMPSIILLSLFILCFISTCCKSSYTFIGVTLLVFMLGFVRYTAAALTDNNNIAQFIGQDHTVNGMVTAEARWHQSADKIYHVRYIIKAHQIDSKTLSGSYYLYTKQKSPAFALPGDTITASGKISAISNYKNPGRIDIQKQAQENNIFASVIAYNNVKITAQPDTMPLLRKITLIRQHIRSTLEKHMPPADAAAIFAMLFGGYQGIDPHLLESFTITGIVHILSVSGSHITLIAGAIIFLGRLFHLKTWLTFVLLLIIISIYCLFSGMVPPVIRSAAMGIITYAALASNRQNFSHYILALTAVIMLLISPGLLFDISFQLSFAATAGLLYIALPLQKKLLFLPAYIRLPLALTLGAQLFCLPLLAWYFNTISLSCLFSNIIAVPIVEAIIMLALVGIIINLFWSFPAAIIFVGCSLLLGLVHEITALLSLLPASSIYLPYLTIYGSIIYYIVLIVLFNDSYRHFFIKNFHCYRQLAIILSILLLIPCIYIFLQPRRLAVHFIDVGQGDAALIITPHHHAVMIDTGGITKGDFDLGRRVDIPYLYHYGITTLDAIFLSHVDGDHSAAAGSILQHIPVQYVFIGQENGSKYAALWHIAPQNIIMHKVLPVQQNQSFILDDVHFDILFTQPSSDKTVNESSVIIKVHYKNFSVLFTGDLPIQEENKLLAQYPNLHCTVLKVAHHGSKTSSSPEFLAAVKPRWSIISVGANNNYGHPNENVIKNLQSVNSRIYRTDKNGAIVFLTDGNSCSIHPYVK